MQRIYNRSTLILFLYSCITDFVMVPQRQHVFKIGIILTIVAIQVTLPTKSGVPCSIRISQSYKNIETGLKRFYIDVLQNQICSYCGTFCIFRYFNCEIISFSWLLIICYSCQQKKSQLSLRQISRLVRNLKENQLLFDMLVRYEASFH